MEEKIISLVKRYKIPICNDTVCYCRHPSFPLIQNIICDIFRKHEEQLILYGGQAATRVCLGFRVLRSLTNDIDVVVRPGCLEDIVRAHEVRYNDVYDFLFFYKLNIQIVLSYYHIHDWVIPPGFYANCRTVKVMGQRVAVCSPEYLIMLKFRRNYEVMKEGHSFFGKDAIDILNVLCAHCFKEGPDPVDCDEVTTLVKNHVTKDSEQIEGLYNHLGDYISHFSKKERDVVSRCYYRFRDCLSN